MAMPQTVSKVALKEVRVELTKLSPTELKFFACLPVETAGKQYIHSGTNRNHTIHTQVKRPKTDKGKSSRKIRLLFPKVHLERLSTKHQEQIERKSFLNSWNIRHTKMNSAVQGKENNIKNGRKHKMDDGESQGVKGVKRLRKSVDHATTAESIKTENKDRLQGTPQHPRTTNSHGVPVHTDGIKQTVHHWEQGVKLDKKNSRTRLMCARVDNVLNDTKNNRKQGVKLDNQKSRIKEMHARDNNVLNGTKNRTGSCNGTNSQVTGESQVKQGHGNNNNRLHQCTVCDKKFKRKKDMTHHMKSHCQTSVVFSCDKCEAMFNTKESLNQHLTKHDEMYFSCYECKKYLSRPLHLSFYVMTDHGVKNCVCHSCAKTF